MTTATDTAPVSSWRYNLMLWQRRVITDDGIRYGLFVFLVSRLIVWFGTYIGEIAIPGIDGEGYYHAVPNNLFFDIWARWDSSFYLAIANDGYTYVPDSITTVAFFPLYPMLMKLLGNVTGDNVIAGVIVSHLALLGGLIYLYKFTETISDSETAKRATFFLAAFPTSFYFSAVYTESLYLFVTVAAAYFARKKMWAWASIFAFLSSTTRVFGLLMFGVVGLEWLHTHGWYFKRILKPEAWRGALNGIKQDWKSLAIIMFAPLGLLSHMRFLNNFFGDPILFSTVQSAWERENVGPVAIMRGELTKIFTQRYLTGDIAWHILFDVSVFFVCLILLVWIWHKVGEGHAIIVAISTISPAISASQSIMRYVIVLYPVFIVLAMFTKNRQIERGVLIAFATMLGVLSTIFVNWVFVA